MHCPTCSSTLLNVQISFSGNVACQFSEAGEFTLLENVALDTQFDDDAGCHCLSCGWEGEVGDLSARRRRQDHAHPQPTGSRGLPLSNRQLRELAAEVARLHPSAQKTGEKLLQEVYRLRSLLDAVSRVASKPSTSDGDTWIG